MREREREKREMELLGPPKKVFVAEIEITKDVGTMLSRREEINSAIEVTSGDYNSWLPIRNETEKWEGKYYCMYVKEGYKFPFWHDRIQLN